MRHAEPVRPASETPRRCKVTMLAVNEPPPYSASKGGLATEQLEDMLFQKALKTGVPIIINRLEG
jgi:hypothetical protein